MNLIETNKANRAGFSLLELMVVMAVIAILMTLTVGVFGRASQGGAEARAKGEIAGLMNELEKYFADEGGYPPNAGWADFEDWYNAKYGASTVWEITEEGDAGNPIDPWGREYIYEPGPSPFVYLIGSEGRDGNADHDDITNRNGALN
jgi:prepilin-type N-terminal cleavage/methylation domain-containing protein